jgi:acid phosphatase
MRQDLEAASIAEWFNGYLGIPTHYRQLIVENEVYRRLGVGPLLGDVLDRFMYSTKTPWEQKMALYGTHDTTIAALLATFGVFDNRWPCFTSSITFELFKAQQGGLLSFLGRNQYFVRMRYNQKVVTLPGMSLRKLSNGSLQTCRETSEGRRKPMHSRSVQSDS